MARPGQPKALQSGAFTRLGAPMSRAQLAFDDPLSARRFADRIETLTVDSVFEMGCSAAAGVSR